jgi:hypothetical protein
MTPLGPRVITCPFGSVTTSKEVGKGMVDPPMTMPPGTEICKVEVDIVSVVPDTVVREPFGRVSVVGRTVVTDPLNVLCWLDEEFVTCKDWVFEPIVVVLLDNDDEFPGRDIELILETLLEDEVEAV